jgi:hypothetical protein
MSASTKRIAKSGLKSLFLKEVLLRPVSYAKVGVHPGRGHYLLSRKYT